jgi:hypothetical protein
MNGKCRAYAGGTIKKPPALRPRLSRSWFRLIMQLHQSSTAGFAEPKIKESVKKRRRLRKSGGKSCHHQYRTLLLKK